MSEHDEVTLENINESNLVDENGYPVAIDLARAAAERVAFDAEKDVPSKYRNAADAMDSKLSNGINPWKLPRFYVTNVDGTRTEVIRGFDKCLLSNPDKPSVGCNEPVKSRGLCARDKTRLAGKVASGSHDWAYYESIGACLPGARKTAREDAFSMSDYLTTLEARLEVK